MSNLIEIKANLNKNLPIVVSNKIIEAHFSLPIGEQRIIYTYMSKLGDTQNDFPELEISAIEFANLIGLSDPNYVQIKQQVNHLMDRRISIETEDEYVTFHWFSVARYMRKTGRIKLKIHDELKPYLLNLKKEFTKFIAKQLVKFRSSYAVRIYMMCKQYQAIGDRIISITELRRILGIKEEEYKLYSNFKARVLIQAKNEINKNSDIEIEIHEIKEARKVTEILLEIKKNNRTQVKEEKLMGNYEDKPSGEIAMILKEELRKRWKEDFTIAELVRYKKETMLELLSLIFQDKYKDKKIPQPRIYFKVALQNIENGVRLF